MKKVVIKILKILFPFILGGSILYWMYRQMDFSEVGDVMFHQMDWTWMLLSFIPGILAQVFRGLRWRQSLEPLEEYPRRHNCVNAIFLSYAVSLVIPRIGEVLRCGVLNRSDGTSFPKALGTVVTERAIDTLIMLLLISTVFIWQMPVLTEFLGITGFDLHQTFSNFSKTGIIVTVICVVCIIIMAYLLLRRLSFMSKVHNTMHDMKSGILSLKDVRNMPLYIFYSVGIWVAYFLHYYFTFFCFDFTANLGIAAGLLSFCIGTTSVLVPTPNGAGPWHFAVKTALLIFGLSATNAIIFVLIVHTVQTLLLVVLGIYASICLQFSKRKNNQFVKQS